MYIYIYIYIVYIYIYIYIFLCWYIRLGLWNLVNLQYGSKLGNRLVELIRTTYQIWIIPIFWPVFCHRRFVPSLLITLVCFTTKVITSILDSSKILEYREDELCSVIDLCNKCQLPTRFLADLTNKYNDCETHTLLNWRRSNINKPKLAWYIHKMWYIDWMESVQGLNSNSVSSECYLLYGVQ